MKMSHKQLLLANKNDLVRAKSRYRHEKQAAKQGCSATCAGSPIPNGRLLEKKNLDQVRFPFELQLPKLTIIE